MPWLVVEGVTVKAMVNRQDMVHVEVGTRSRAFDGSMRSTIRDRKREWSVETAPIPRAEAETLLAVLDNTPPLTVSGDLIDESGSVNCTATLESVQYIMAADMRAVVTFRLMES